MELNTVEGNKLIAEFMGAKYVFVEEGVECMDFISDGKLHKRQRIERLKYHSSWDCLMPVVESISNTVIKSKASYNPDYSPRFEIVASGYVKISNLRDTPIYKNISVSGGLINTVWLTVVAFIQWYNSQSTTASPDLKNEMSYGTR